MLPIYRVYQETETDGSQLAQGRLFLLLGLNAYRARLGLKRGGFMESSLLRIIRVAKYVAGVGLRIHGRTRHTDSTIRVKIKEVSASCQVRLPPTAVVMEEKDVNDDEEEEEMLANITSIST